MKKIGVLLLAVVMMLSLGACGKSEEAQQVDDLIAAIGEVSLDNESSIIKAENAILELDEKIQKQLDNTAALDEARNAYNTLLIEEVEAAISDIGTVDLESAPAIEAAKKEYETLKGDLQASVSNYNDLVSAEEAYAEAQVDDIEKVIKAIGTVTLDSTEKISAARETYDKYDAPVQAAVSNYDVLTKAEDSFSDMKIENAVTLISEIGEVTLESGDVIGAIESTIADLKDDEAAKITNIEEYNTAKATYEELKAAAEKQVAIDEARAIVQVTKVAISSPDSAGGVELYFNFKNNSDKVIKYINFGVTFYNAVGDVAKCKYENATTNYCYDTGPFAKGEGRTGTWWHWGDFYNWDIASVDLVYLNIEYTDGTEITLNSDQVEYVQY